MKGFRVQELGISKIAVSILLPLLFLYPIPYTLYPSYAQAPSPLPLASPFGFGDIQSLGQATTNLVTPIFSIAAVLVIIYFLFGAYRFLKAGSSKEEVDAARQMIQHAIVGFILLMLSFLVLQFLLSNLFKVNFQIIGN